MLRRCPGLLMSPVAKYDINVGSGRIRSDAHQRAALVHVERLYQDVVTLQRNGFRPRDMTVPTPRKKVRADQNRIGDGAGAARKSYFGGLADAGAGSSRQESSFGGVHAAAAAAEASSSAAVADLHPLSRIQGVYIHGGVGCGKTYMMDLFFAELPVVKKQRVHFHMFMIEVQKAMHSIKIAAPELDGDELMTTLAVRMCGDAEVLCFDEMVVADIADAMILKRLFNAIYKLGVCAVFTSNRAPIDLYKGGLNRESFLPFIRLISERCIVHDMASGTDYRTGGEIADSYLSPVTVANTAKFNKTFQDVTYGKVPMLKKLRTFGRDVNIAKAVGGVARFTFMELCQADLSAADFGVIADSFHTVFLENVPQFNPAAADVKRRFILLMDELYQYKVKVVILAEVPIKLLAAKFDPDFETDKGNQETFFAGQLMDIGEDQVQMDRCVSRLTEMSTKRYLTEEHLGTEVDEEHAM
jgi:predicted ATPase